jgi:LysM repeat protein
MHTRSTAVEEDTMSTMTASTITASAPFSGSGARLRLTRRGRLLLFVAALLVTLSTMLLAVVPSVVATVTAGAPVPVSEVTVQPGDTLWDIAAAANPGGDVTATVDEIAELNALSDGQLQVGQELAVPIY